MIPLAATLTWFVSSTLIIFVLGLIYSMFTDLPPSEDVPSSPLPAPSPLLSYFSLAALAAGISAAIAMVRMVIKVVVYDEVD